MEWSGCSALLGYLAVCFLAYIQAESACCMNNSGFYRYVRIFTTVSLNSGIQNIMSLFNCQRWISLLAKRTILMFIPPPPP